LLPAALSVLRCLGRSCLLVSHHGLLLLLIRTRLLPRGNQIIVKRLQACIHLAQLVLDTVIRDSWYSIVRDLTERLQSSLDAAPRLVKPAEGVVGRRHRRTPPFHLLTSCLIVEDIPAYSSS
jgi:hypothetical protein